MANDPQELTVWLGKAQPVAGKEEQPVAKEVQRKVAHSISLCLFHSELLDAPPQHIKQTNKQTALS